jgi:hypothetical protein
MVIAWLTGPIGWNTRLSPARARVHSSGVARTCLLAQIARIASAVSIPMSAKSIRLWPECVGLGIENRWFGNR